MSIISVGTTQEELIKTYADFYGVSVSVFVKTSVIEHIEDMFALRSIEEYEKNRKDGSIETYSIHDVKKQLGL